LEEIVHNYVSDDSISALRRFLKPSPAQLYNKTLDFDTCDSEKKTVIVMGDTVKSDTMLSPPHSI